MEGEFEITPEADSYGRQWYYNRPDPEDENMAPYHNPAREMVMKLAMVFALSDGGPLVIDQKHIQLAHAHYQLLQEGACELIELACQTPQTSGTKTTLAVIEKYGEIKHSLLLQKVHAKGMDAQDMRRAIGALMEMKLVSREVTGTGGVLYRRGR